MLSVKEIKTNSEEKAIDVFVERLAEILLMQLEAESAETLSAPEMN
jgi:hypothetical protein